MIHTASFVSSNVASATYDDVARTLDIRFHHGGTYRYFGVPLNIFQGLKAVGSAGTYVHRVIKQFPCARVG